MSSPSDSPPTAPTSPLYSIATINTQSNLAGSTELVLDKLIKQKIDICGIQDTGKNISKIAFNLAGFEIYIRPPDPKDKNGGLALIIKKGLKQLITPKPENEQAKSRRIWAFQSLFPENHSIYLVYNKNKQKDILEQLKKMKTSERDILIGDLNSYPNPELDFVSASPSPKNNYKFVSELIQNGWFDTFRTKYPEKRAFSRMGIAGKNKNKYLTASRIDHILVRSHRIEEINDAHIIEENECDSDHRMVITRLLTYTTIKNKEQKKIKFREGLKDKQKWEKFKEELPTLTGKDTIYEKSEEIRNNIINTFEKIFPEKEIIKKQFDRKIFTTKQYSETKFKKRMCYNITAHLKSVIVDKNEENHELLNHYINKLENPPHKLIGEYTQETLTAAHNCEVAYGKILRSILRRDRRDKIYTCVDKIIKKVDKDGHNAVKIMNENSGMEIACLIDDQKIITEDDRIESKLNETWANVFQNKKKRTKEIEEFLQYLPEPKTKVKEPDFSTENIKRIIKNKSPTAPGESKISWQMLKFCTEGYIKELSNMYKLMYEHNMCPSGWKDGITKLIPKPETAPTPEGFRPITLLSVEYKLYTSILTDTLLNWTLENGIIPPSQNGALPDRGCDTCLWTLLSTINESQKTNHPLHVYYIDYSKAFDSVEHWVLDSIFEHLNIGQLGYVISSLLASSTTRLKINEKISDTRIPIQRGTKQGDVISPLLFLIFMAPCLWQIEKTCKGISINKMGMKCAAIMDDVVLTTDDNLEAKYMINVFRKFSEVTGIQINPKKSAYAYKNVSHKVLPVIDNKPFEDLGSEKSYRYLGVWINLELNWETTHTKILEMVAATLAAINKKFYLPPRIMYQLINSTVYAKIGYRMQIHMFDRSWLNKVESLVTTSLNKVYHTPTKGTAIWSVAFGLKSLQEMNYQRYVGSLWRTLQRYDHNLAKNNLTQLLKRQPKPLQATGPVKWTEPQDAIEALSLKWFHRDLHQHTPLPYNNLLPFPTIQERTQYPERTATAWLDGSMQCKKDNKIYLAASIVTNDGFETSWPVRGPPCSTEAEIQATIGFAVTHPNTKRLIAYTDSLGSINAIMNTRNSQHKNLHNSPNRVSLRELREITKERTIIHTQKPIEMENKSLQLIHIYSHGKEDKNKKEKNEKKFGPESAIHIKYNDKADSLAKRACTLAVEPHPPLHPFADPFIIFHPKFPYAEIKTIINIQIGNIEMDRFEARDYTKASRWKHPSIDLEAAIIPLRARNVTKQLQLFTLKLLTSNLPTKHNVRKTKWFRELDPAHPKKTLYETDKCPLCSHTETHKHVFDECQATTPYRKALVEEITELIKKHRKSHLPPAQPKWWFTYLGKSPIINDDIQWRGFLPCTLADFLKQNLKDSETAKKVRDQIAIAYQKNNLDIWINRCKALHNDTYTGT